MDPRLRSPRRRARCLPMLLTLVAAGACAPSPERAWLVGRNAERAGRVAVEAPDGARAALGPAVQRLEAAGVEVDFGPAPAPAVRVVVGTFDDAQVRAALRPLGVDVAGARPVWNDRELEPGDVLVATLEDPRHRGLPVTVAAGDDPLVAARTLGDLAPPRLPGLRIWRDGRPVLSIRLEASGAPVAGSLVEPPEVPPPARTLEGGGVALELPEGADPPRLGAYRAAARLARKRTIEVLGGGVDAGEVPRVRVRAVPREAIVRRTAPGRTWIRNRVTNEIDVLLEDGAPDDGGAGVAEATAHLLHGEPAAAWMADGVAAWGAATWWGRPREEWLAHILQSELFPSVADILDPAADLSPHVLLPARGALFEHLLTVRGADFVRALWTGAETLAAEERLERRFRVRLDEVRRAHAEQLSSRRGRWLADVVGRGPYRGVHLVEPSGLRDRERAGYGTRAARESVERAAALGANAAALLSWASLEPGPPELAGDPPVSRYQLAGDLALATTVADARRSGMGVLLRPMLLATRSGNLAGKEMVHSSQALAEFFQSLSPVVVHHALFAELVGAEILCLGSELKNTTETDFAAEPRIRPPSYTPQRLDHWRELIVLARRAYSGSLLYAANGEGEAPRIEFWSDLDYVGLDLFPSLAGVPYEGDRPDDWQASQRLRHRCDRLLALAERVGRPAMLVEVGFPSAREAWLDSRLPLGEYDPGEQARLIDALGDAIERLEDRERLAGVFLWSWSTDPDAGGPGHRGHTPQNKAADDALRRLFAAP